MLERAQYLVVSWAERDLVHKEKSFVTVVALPGFEAIYTYSLLANTKVSLWM